MGQRLNQSRSNASAPIDVRPVNASTFKTKRYIIIKDVFTVEVEKRERPSQLQIVKCSKSWLRGTVLLAYTPTYDSNCRDLFLSLDVLHPQGPARS